MTYAVEISTSAAKSIAKIEKKTRLRVIGAIELLALDPRPPGVKMLRGGEQGRWRARVGGSRIVYTVGDDRLIVLVLRAEHRREVYDR